MASYIKTDNGTVKIGSGDIDVPVSIENGGTSATTVPQALENLCVYDQENQYFKIKPDVTDTSDDSQYCIYDGLLTIYNSTAGTNTYHRAFREDTGLGVCFGIGTGGANHGIYSMDNSGDSAGQSLWILYGNSSKDTTMQGSRKAIIKAGSAATEIVGGGVSAGNSNTTDATCIVIHPPTLVDTDNTGTAFVISARADCHWAEGYTASTTSSCLLRGGCDSTARFLSSPATYFRTTSSSANVYITSRGTFARYSSSSARYKNNIQYLTHDENATEAAMEHAAPKTLSNKERSEWEADLLSILDLPVVRYHFNDGYICEPQDYDAENTWETGFIAEDVDEICPDMCTYVEDEDGNKIPEAWDYMKLLPRMVYVMQQQEARIKELEAKIGE